MRVLSLVKKRFRQLRELKITKMEKIGQGSQGTVFRKTIQRKDRTHSYAVKQFRYRDWAWNAFTSYAKLQILKALGFRTVYALPPTNKQRLAMRDLTAGGEKRTVDIQQVLYHFSRLLQEPEHYDKTKNDYETMFRLATNAVNFKELAKEYEKISELETKWGIRGVGMNVTLVIDKNRRGELWVTDVVEVSIPKKIILKEMVPKPFQKILDRKGDWI